MERRINLFLKKHQNKMTLAALPFLAVGLFRKSLWGEGALLAAALLCFFPIFFRAMTALRFRTVSIELLVSIAVLGAVCIGEYEECALVTFLFQFGSYLEALTLKKTRSAIRALAASAPRTAFRMSEGEVEEIDAKDVEEGDRLLVKEGGMVAVDGTVLAGEGSFNESSITGEGRAVGKSHGDFLYAGSILERGTVEMRADRVGEDTTYARIVELVEEAEDAKSPVERFIDRFARYYTPFVIVAAVLVLLCTRSVDTAVTVLVLACPGALVIGAPIASVSGIGRGAREGILFKGGDVIHSFARCTAFLFDKTGTLTVGSPAVSRCALFEGGEAWLGAGARLELFSSHPLGRAIIEYAREHGELPEDVTEARVLRGRGMSGLWRGEELLLGSEELLRERGIAPDAQQQKEAESFREEGATVVFLAGGGVLRCILAISDEPREGAAEALSALSRRGARLVMLTGDRREAAEHMARRLGLREVRSELLPEEKYAVLEAMQQRGEKVCFVGDGINDSPSIVLADTGIAMGSGTDVAIECSDVVILRQDLSAIPEAYALARRIRRVTTENIVIAVGTVFALLGLLLAGRIHMSGGMLIHELSILLVILNGMKLLTGRKRT